MGTTLIIVELLIIGFQVLVWAGLLLHHFDAIPAWPEPLKGCNALFVGVLVGTAYTLGIVCDRVLGHLSTVVQAGVRHVIDTRQSKSNSGTYEASVQKRPRADEKERILEFYARHIYAPHAYGALENANRHIRLLRATCVNSIIMAITLFLWYRSDYKRLSISLLILALFSLLAWLMSSRMRKKNVLMLYRGWQEEQAAEASERQRPDAPKEQTLTPRHDDGEWAGPTSDQGHTPTGPATK
jgi:hypothetical protein